MPHKWCVAEVGQSSMSQLELQIERTREPDRNAEQGGRSFYFFDLDDNVFFLSTPIYVFHRESGDEIALSTGAFAQTHREIGKSGPLEKYEIRFDDENGSYRRFRDWSPTRLLERGLRHQPFIADIEDALSKHDFHWKGPSWAFFYHAVFNQRPVSIITARGHHPDTLKRGIEALAKHGHLPDLPNYLGVYPVSHPGTRRELGDATGSWSIAQLKKAAIMRSVETAFERYGDNPYHRFGMSDDDPHNIEQIHHAMRDLKSRYQQNSFFVIASSKDSIEKQEVLLSGVHTSRWPAAAQLDLFSPVR